MMMASGIFFNLFGVVSVPTILPEGNGRKTVDSENVASFSICEKEQVKVTKRRARTVCIFMRLLSHATNALIYTEKCTADSCLLVYSWLTSLLSN